MESMSILGLPYFPDWTEDWTDDEPNEFTRSSPDPTPSSPKSIHKIFPTLIHKPKLVALSRQSTADLPDRPSIYSSSDYLQRQVAVAAGVAIAVTAGAIGLNQTPVYEGSVQLTAQTVGAHVGAQASTNSRYVPAQPSVAPPDLMPFSTDVLTSRLLLDPVVQQLKLPQLTYQSLVKNLKLTSENGLISLRYRDTDPQRVQLVLAQITQAYVNYGQTCQGNSCRGVQYIETQIPQSQARIQQLSTEIEQLQRRYGVNDFQAQLKLLEARTADVAKQEAQLQGTLADEQRDYRQLRQQLSGSLTSSLEDIVPQLLSARYHSLLSQFQTLDQQLGDRFVNSDGDPNELRATQAQHQRVTTQLAQEAQSILPQYLTNSSGSAPMVQNETDLQLLQQSILTFNSMQMMQARQATLKQAQQNLEQQRSQLIKFLGQSDRLRLRLDLETNKLRLQFEALKTLQSRTQPETVLTVTDDPDVSRDQNGQPIARIPNLTESLGIGAALGILAGVGVSTALARKRMQSDSTEGNASVDALMNRARELADMKLRSQLSPAA
jgi:uncharacterized protein involved in exopolysaccharide biosynthesis